MDNLGSHKGPVIHRAIRPRRTKLLFLPYSPDLNPVEHVFVKFQLLMGVAGERIIDAACQRIGSLLDQLIPQECEIPTRYRHLPGSRSRVRGGALGGW
jgi:DDE superfamily endonuclease